MAIQNNKRVLDRKEWQTMSSMKANSAAGSFVIKDLLGIRRLALFVVSATSQYLYAADEDDFMPITSMALGGTFGAGACGCWGLWSNTLTANGGSTTTVTTATSINNAAIGRTIRFLTGTNAGQEVTVTKAKIIPGGTNTLTFTPELSAAIVNTDTFAVDTGRYYIWNAGTMSATSYKSIDPLTGVVTALSVTNAPATWGTDGKLIATPSYVGYYSTGTATSATGTTIVCSTKTWTSGQWINYQVRIVSGTGIGQIRTITDNDATSLTVATWSVNPDTTSVFKIEANDDFLYLAGNGVKTMYRYSISGNSWSTISPTSARATTPSTGMSLNWIGKTGDDAWADENAILDGRYIYSFTGGATSTLDRYDISGGTAGAGTWQAITYLGAQDTFTTGSSYDVTDGKIFIRRNATNIFYYYNVTGNNIYPFATDQYADGTAVLGDKLFTVAYDDGTGGDIIEWLYYWQNTGAVIRRIMIF